MRRCLKTVTSVVVDEWNARTIEHRPLIFHDYMNHHTTQTIQQQLACTRIHRIATAIQIQRKRFYCLTFFVGTNLDFQFDSIVETWIKIAWRCLTYEINCICGFLQFDIPMAKSTINEHISVMPVTEQLCIWLTNSIGRAIDQQFSDAVQQYWWVQFFDVIWTILSRLWNHRINSNFIKEYFNTVSGSTSPTARRLDYPYSYESSSEYK